VIIRYTAYTTSPRAGAERSRKHKEKDPEGWSLGGWGGPVTFLLDKERSIILEVPDEMEYTEVRAYCEGLAAERGWPITEGRIENHVGRPEIIRWRVG